MTKHDEVTVTACTECAFSWYIKWKYGFWQQYVRTNNWYFRYWVFTNTVFQKLNLFLSPGMKSHIQIDPLERTIIKSSYGVMSIMHTGWYKQIQFPKCCLKNPKQWMVKSKQQLGLQQVLNSHEILMRFLQYGWWRLKYSGIWKCGETYIVGLFRPGPLNPQLASNIMLPIKQCYRGIQNEKTSFNPFPGEVKIECWSNFRNFLSSLFMEIHAHYITNSFSKTKC